MNSLCNLYGIWLNLNSKYETFSNFLVKPRLTPYPIHLYDGLECFHVSLNVNNMWVYSFVNALFITDTMNFILFLSQNMLFDLNFLFCQDMEKPQQINTPSHFLFHYPQACCKNHYSMSFFPLIVCKICFLKWLIHRTHDRVPIEAKNELVKIENQQIV